MQVDAVLLRDATSLDIETLLSFRNEAGANRFMLRTSVEPEEFRREWTHVPASSTDFSCVASVEDEVVGIGYLDVEDGMGQPGMPRGTEAMIGYFIDPDHAGRGHATAIAQGLLTAAFERLGLRRVTAGCFADNRASARVLEKAGMRREQHGIGDSWHAELGWIDGYTYAVLDAEWRANRF